MNNNFQIFQYDGSQYNQLIPNSSNTATNSTQLGGVESNLYATKEYVNVVAPNAPYNSAYEGWTKIGTITFEPNEITSYTEKKFNLPEYMNFCMLEVTGPANNGIYWGSSRTESDQEDKVNALIILGQGKKERYVAPCVYSYNKDDIGVFAVVPNYLRALNPVHIVSVVRVDTLSISSTVNLSETIYCTLYYR